MGASFHLLHNTFSTKKKKLKWTHFWPVYYIDNLVVKISEILVPNLLCKRSPGSGEVDLTKNSCHMGLCQGYSIPADVIYSEAGPAICVQVILIRKILPKLVINLNDFRNSINSDAKETKFLESHKAMVSGSWQSFAVPWGGYKSRTKAQRRQYFRIS